MTLSMVKGIFTISFTAIASVGLALLMLLLGQKIKNNVAFLQKYCIPAPVIGGLLFAIANLLLHQAGIANVALNSAYQGDMQNLFFTCVGFTITFSLLKKGGSRLIRYFILAAILAVIQGVVGVVAANMVHAEPWLGLMCGPASLSGGHGNAAAYGDILDKMGHFATVAGMAAATFGLVTGSLFGGPMAERLITKYKLVKAENTEEEKLAEQFKENNTKALPINVFSIFEHVTLLCILLAIGIYVKSLLHAAFGISIPEFAGGALLACILSNINEQTHWLAVNPKIMTGIQDFCLGIFLSLAMSSLKLWQLADLAIPMVIILFAGLFVTLVYLYFIVFRVCGKDFDAAVMCAGMCGHGLGASPTAFANMDSITQKYGESKISYLCVTVVGGILMDWVLLVINTTMVNMFG